MPAVIYPVPPLQVGRVQRSKQGLGVAMGKERGAIRGIVLACRCREREPALGSHLHEQAVQRSGRAIERLLKTMTAKVAQIIFGMNDSGSHLQ